MASIMQIDALALPEALPIYRRRDRADSAPAVPRPGQVPVQRRGSRPGCALRHPRPARDGAGAGGTTSGRPLRGVPRSEEHTSELQSRRDLVCRLLLEKKMSLAHGGHLTHGHPLNFSGLTYKFVAYGVSKETETIDYNEVAKLAAEHKPRMLVVGASAYSRIIDFARMGEIARSIGAMLFVDMAHIAFFVTAAATPNIYTLSLHVALPI